MNSEKVIIPILKKGGWSNADTNRRIVISSCVGKLYLKILTKCIDHYMVASGLWSQNQCGCKKDHRTEDPIYESCVVNIHQNISLAFDDFSEYMIWKQWSSYFTNYWSMGLLDMYIMQQTVCMTTSTTQWKHVADVPQASGLLLV